MANKLITLTSDVETLNNSGDTYQLELVFEVVVFLSNENFTFAEKNIEILNHGKIELDYRLDDRPLVPAVVQLKLADTDKYLHDLLFGTTTEQQQTIKQFQVEIKINGTSEFLGVVLSDAINYDYDSKVLDVKVSTKTDVLNKTEVYDDKDRPAPTDPLGRGNYDTSSSIDSVTNNGDGTFTIQTVNFIPVANDDIVLISGTSGVDGLNAHFIVFNEDNDPLNYARFDIELVSDDAWTGGGTVKTYEENIGLQSDLVTNLILEIYQLVDSSVALSVKHNWQFRYDTSNVAEFTEITQGAHRLYFNPDLGEVDNLGDVLKKLATDWVSFTGMTKNNQAFFHKLFYYDSGDLQTVDVLTHRKIYFYPIIEFVRAELEGSSPKRWEAGTFTLQENKRLIREKILPFVWETATASATNIFNQATGDAVEQVRDSEVDSNNWHDNGYLIANYLFDKLSGGDNYSSGVRVDRFTAFGVTYDYLKNFNHDSKKYQIIRLVRDFEQNMSEIDALYLGEV